MICITYRVCVKERLGQVAERFGTVRTGGETVRFTTDPLNHRENRGNWNADGKVGLCSGWVQALGPALLFFTRMNTDER